jgi:hypothetical protein
MDCRFHLRELSQYSVGFSVEGHNDIPSLRCSVKMNQLDAASIVVFVLSEVISSIHSGKLSFTARLVASAADFIDRLLFVARRFRRIERHLAAEFDDRFFVSVLKLLKIRQP